MQVTCTDIQKKFVGQTVLARFSYIFESGKQYTLTGKNGSGKSTLLQLIAGYQLPNKGTIEYKSGSTPIDPSEMYTYMSIAGPSVELIEEFTLIEHLHFHTQFKPLRKGFTPENCIQYLRLESHQNKAIRFFSSGMKQRLKILLALVSDCTLVILDEPCTNFDAETIAWYQSFTNQIIQDFNPTLIIASNDPQEYQFLQSEILSMENFK
jgi:ABC-type multidrug transport system ATPase subunit